jgi:ubiquinone/menaquinone biosynthesis C-methylase UbiE
VGLANVKAAEKVEARRLRRQYVKFCDRRDFDDPEVRARIREIVPNLEPEAELHRKYWEYATLTLFLEDVGALHDDAEVLDVGAGHEEVVYWLANRVGRVVATDIYGEGAFAGREAEASMLSDPSAFAPYPYREDRLEARSMDARSLELPDASFEVVFSLSSIEHFGSSLDIAQAARELGRVLRPGGHAFVVTECFLARHPLNSRLVQTAIRALTLGRLAKGATPRHRAIEVFTPAELLRQIVRPAGLVLLQQLDRTLSPETWENVQSWVGDGLQPATGAPFPHIILQHRGTFPFKTYGAPWTSVALAMRKPTS